MNIYVFSDSHSNCFDMIDIIKKDRDKIDYVIHLGDHCNDSKIIDRLLQITPMVSVIGNCDYFCGDEYEEEKCFEILGKRFFICHGHKYSVKSTYDFLYAAAKQKGADVALFGHTHNAVIEKRGDITILNPGSIGRPKGTSGPTYGIITIKDNKIDFKICEV